MILFAPPTLLDRMTIGRFSTRFDARVVTISDPHSWPMVVGCFHGIFKQRCPGTGD